MHSAVISARRGYPAMLLAEQLAHQRSVHSGPLVLRAAPLKSPTPTADRDRPVSRRSEPSSRAALMGEQPNPWDLIQPQDATSRHRGAERSRRYGLLDFTSLSFCPVSHGPSTQYRGITKPCFRICSACLPCSQAPLCLCTLWLVSIQPEGTFGRLRYLLGGDRPSQTAHLARSPDRITVRG
jgi:hypothetical protein